MACCAQLNATIAACAGMPDAYHGRSEETQLASKVWRQHVTKVDEAQATLSFVSYFIPAAVRYPVCCRAIHVGGARVALVVLSPLASARRAGPVCTLSGGRGALTYPPPPWRTPPRQPS
eukprot:scaffold1402_cov403-Prasinococcus_capsulatus_cf.AAC.9